MLAGAVPRRSFRPFWIAPKGARRRGGEIPKLKKCGAKPAGGGKPLPYGCKWGGRVWDPPLRRHKGRKGPTVVGATSGRPQTARRGRGPGRPLLALWANSPSRAPRKWSLLPVLPAAPRGSTREGASKQVARTALWFCCTVATGGRTAMRQRSPRAGTFAPDFRTKLPRKRGSGGVVTMDRPHPYQNGCDLSIGANPRRFFGSFLIAQKATRRRGGETSPKSKGATQRRREGQAPPLR